MFFGYSYLANYFFVLIANLSLIMTYHCVCNKSDMTGETSGAGISNSSRVHHFRSLFVFFLPAIVLWINNKNTKFTLRIGNKYVPLVWMLQTEKLIMKRIFKISWAGVILPSCFTLEQRNYVNNGQSRWTPMKNKHFLFLIRHLQNKNCLLSVRSGFIPGVPVAHLFKFLRSFLLRPKSCMSNAAHVYR
jgi:hypothetical protein